MCEWCRASNVRPPRQHVKRKRHVPLKPITLELNEAEQVARFRMENPDIDGRRLVALVPEKYAELIDANPNYAKGVLTLGRDKA